MNKTKDTAFYRELIRLLIPIAIENFMLALVSATDAVMLRFIDQDSMSAVSLAGQIQFGLNLLVSAFCMGVGIMAAQYWGKQDTRTIEEIAPAGLKILLAIGGTVMLAAWIIPEKLMAILTNDPDLISLGGVYIRTVAPSYLLCGISQLYFAMLKNTGNAGKSSAISSSAVLLNILLNAVLIFGLLGFPALGIRGAALATAITRAVEMVCAAWGNGQTGCC